MAPTEKNKLRPLPPSSEICYFLGAGFSKASKYELPTAEGFLSRDARIYCRKGVVFLFPIIAIFRNSWGE